MLTRASSRIALGAALVVVAGCSNDRTAASPTEVYRVPVFEEVPAQAGMGDDGIHAHVKLRGKNETPPNASRAKGEATLVLSHDGNSMSYVLTVSNIDNVFMAHIHMAPKGVAGPIVQWLYPGVTPPPGPCGAGPFHGLLAKGSFTSATFAGPLKGKAMADLVNAIKAGNAYVNVHTCKTGAAAGPGNLPAGEIRGQIPFKDHNHDVDDR